MEGKVTRLRFKLLSGLSEFRYMLRRFHVLFGLFPQSSLGLSRSTKQFAKKCFLWNFGWCRSMWYCVLAISLSLFFSLSPLSLSLPLSLFFSLSLHPCRVRPQNSKEQIDMCQICTFCTPGRPHPHSLIDNMAIQWNGEDSLINI